MEETIKEMEYILNKEELEKFCEFSKNILNEYNYIVALNLRTLKLLNFFKNYLLQKKEIDFNIKIVTLNSLYSNMDYFIEQKFKRIALVIDCLKDGREVNIAISLFKELATKKLKEKFPNSSIDVEVYNLLENINTYIFNEAPRKSLIYGPYCKYLKKPIISSTLKDFYNNQNNFIQLAGYGLISLIPNSLTISLNDFTQEEQKIILTRLNQMPKVEFKKNKDISWIKNIKKSNQIVATISFYGTMDSCTKSLKITPYIFYSSINEDQILSFFAEIDQNLALEVKKEWINEQKRSLILDSFIYLVHQNMLLELLDGIKNIEYRIDYSYLEENYQTLSYIQKYKNRINPWVEKGKIEELFLKRIGEPFPTSITNLTSKVINIFIDNEDKILTELEEKIFQLGYLRAKRSNDIVHRRSFYDSNEIYETLENFLTTILDEETYFKMVHILLENLNIGTLRIDSMLTYKKLSQVCVATEEAFLIKPLKLQAFWAILNACAFEGLPELKEISEAVLPLCQEKRISSAELLNFAELLLNINESVFNLDTLQSFYPREIQEVMEELYLQNFFSIKIEKYREKREQIRLQKRRIN